MKNSRTLQAVLTASMFLFLASTALADRLDEIKSRGRLRPRRPLKPHLNTCTMFNMFNIVESD